MPDDDLIDLLQTPKSLEPTSGEFGPKPNQRSSLNAFLILFVFGVPIGYLFSILQDHPGGIQVAAMVAYTFAILYITSNRFLNPVPWALLNRFRERFLLVHSLALAVVYAITTRAYVIKPHLPAWFVVSGRKGSFFDWCLTVIFFIPAFCESFWILRHKDKENK